jgi:hypothetical protein
MPSTEQITELSSDGVERSVVEFLQQVTPAHKLKVSLPNGNVVVVMSSEDFENYVLTSAILSNPERAVEQSVAHVGETLAELAKY